MKEELYWYLIDILSAGGFFSNDILILFSHSANKGVSIKWAEVHQNETPPGWQTDDYQLSDNFLYVFQISSSKQDVWANRSECVCAVG